MCGDTGSTSTHKLIDHAHAQANTSTSRTRTPAGPHAQQYTYTRRSSCPAVHVHPQVRIPSMCMYTRRSASPACACTPAGPHAQHMHVHIDPAAENPEAEAEHEQRSATDVDSVDVNSPSQLSMLMQLVTQMAQVQLTQATRRFSQKVSLAKLRPGDDVEAFLTSFERSMRAYRVPPDDWVYLLSPQLTDKALLAYTELASTEADSYDRVKEAIAMQLPPKQAAVNFGALRCRTRSA